MGSEYTEIGGGELVDIESIRGRFRSMGLGIKLFKGCRIVGSEQVAIGDHSQIDEGVRFFGGKGISIGRYVHFAFESSISGGGSV